MLIWVAVTPGADDDPPPAVVAVVEADPEVVDVVVGWTAR